MRLFGLVTVLVLGSAAGLQVSGASNDFWEQRIVVSLLLSEVDNDVENESCIGGIIVNGTEYAAADLESAKCGSFAQAVASCNQTSYTQAFQKLCDAWNLSDIAKAIENGTDSFVCEFLFVSWTQNASFAVENSAGTPQLAANDAFAHHFAFYPWQHSANDALKQKLSLLSATQRTANVQVHGSFFAADGGDILLRDLSLTVSETIQSSLISLTDGNLELDELECSDVLTTGNGSCVNVEGDVSLTIANSHFYGNAADNGGSVYINGANDIQITNSNFSDNTATAFDGGAVYLRHCSEITFEDCLFEGNDAKDDSGALNLIQNKDVSIDSCVFKGNVATDLGGAIRFDRNRNVSVTNSTVEDNIGRSIGGGLHFAECAQVTIADSRILRNAAYHSGGGVRIYDCGEVLLSNVVFEENESEMMYGGAVAVHITDDLVFEHCAFVRNRAERGAALSVSLTGIGTVDTCLFANNTATQRDCCKIGGFQVRHLRVG